MVSMAKKDAPSIQQAGGFPRFLVQQQRFQLKRDLPPSFPSSFLQLAAISFCLVKRTGQTQAEGQEQEKRQKKTLCGGR